MTEWSCSWCTLISVTSETESVWASVGQGQGQGQRHGSPRWPPTAAGPCSWWWWRPAASEGSAGTAGWARTDGPRPSPTVPPDAFPLAPPPRSPSHADAEALRATEHTDCHDSQLPLLFFWGSSSVFSPFFAVFSSPFWMSMYLGLSGKKGSSTSSITAGIPVRPSMRGQPGHRANTDFIQIISCHVLCASSSNQWVFYLCCCPGCFWCLALVHWGCQRWWRAVVRRRGLPSGFLERVLPDTWAPRWMKDLQTRK